MTDEITLDLGQIAAVVDVLLNGTGDETRRPFVLVLCEADGFKTEAGATVIKATVLSNISQKAATEILKKAAAMEEIRFHQ